jgi:hypothetical protein
MQHFVFSLANSLSKFILFGFFLLVTACTPATPTAALEPIRIQYTFAAQPWLANLYACAGANIIAAELRVSASQDPRSTDVVMRIGQPDKLTTTAYQVGSDDLLIIINRQNPLKILTTDQVRGLFTGRIQSWKSVSGADAPVQVWVFPTGEDVQQIFEQSVLSGSPVTSAARLANSPDEMSQVVSNDVNAIGIITRHWKTEDTSAVFTGASSLPVLAITLSTPHGGVVQILTCLQK